MNDHGYRVARANGGFKYHLLPYGYTTALCGKVDPVNNKARGSTHWNRARWVFHGRVTSLPERVACEKCQAEAVKFVAADEAAKSENAQVHGSEGKP